GCLCIVGCALSRGLCFASVVVPCRGDCSCMGRCVCICGCYCIGSCSCIGCVCICDCSCIGSCSCIGCVCMGGCCLHGWVCLLQRWVCLHLWAAIAIVCSSRIESSFAARLLWNHHHRSQPRNIEQGLGHLPGVVRSAHQRAPGSDPARQQDFRRAGGGDSAEFGEGSDVQRGRT